MKPHFFELSRIVKAFRYSLLGLKYAFLHERAFFQEVFGSLIALPVAWWVSETLGTFVLLMGVLILLLIVELLNTAIEATLDRVSTEMHPLAAQAKDCAAAAVLLTLILAICVWLYVFYERFF